MARLDLDEMLASRPAPLENGSPTGAAYFDYRIGQPNLFLMMNFKQLLVERHGIAKGVDFYRQTITRQRDATLEKRLFESHHAYCARHAVELHEIIRAGEAFVIDPPRVIGQGNHRPLRNQTRAFYVSALRDATVRGRSAVTEVADYALADFQGDELARIDDDVEFDSGVFHRDGDTVWTLADAQPPLELDAAFSLLGARTDFFGDWFSDYIARYVAATMTGHVPDVPVLIDAHMPPTHRQALEMNLMGRADLIEVPSFQAVRVKRLWQAPSLSYIPFHQRLNEKFRWDYMVFSPAHRLPLLAELQRRANRTLSANRGPARVFLARKSFRHRKMVNYREIERIAEAYGFERVYTEDLDFPDQVKLLRDARYVLGPEGSSFFLGCFLQPGARVCILNHQQTEGLTLHKWPAPLEIDLTVLTGPQAGPLRGRTQDMDFWIDPETLTSFLEDWSSKPDRI
ncbi:glycosyltransferase family 61 protein [Jannaschia seohaensis]|uniref:Uncharacterized protein DUF563 n=1 Tax=Jannaschia seohaensis TaxID=475081 RepID=A0A2Y9APD7_9RHOB|nr:glycosyltransferase family 61 protein [Jannaschia seohaensis]PWJ20215.1 uncharacterized protein DUF563 [Jannaschia seohaensis]SSA44209.1 Protein of unknown function [Jannaschia seohaensis]